MAELNKGMKVFSELFVGIQKASKDEIPLGFATPYETNAAGRKRQETVKSWLFGYSTEHNPDQMKIITNIPRAGFRITSDVKRVYWGGGNVVWRVEDPAGFELEIQSQNLMSIIQVAGIGENGHIPGQCMWGRDGSTNILLHEKSEEFKNAVLAAETIKKPPTLSKNSMVVGNSYKLANGQIGRYVGQWWAAGLESAETHRHSYFGAETANLDISANTYAEVHFTRNSAESFGKYYVILIGNEMAYFYKSVTLVELHKENPITLEAAGEIIKHKKMTFAAGGSLNDRRSIYTVTQEEITSPKLEYVPASQSAINRTMPGRDYYSDYYSDYHNDNYALNFLNCLPANSEMIVVYKDEDGSLYNGGMCGALDKDTSIAIKMDVMPDGKVIIVGSTYKRGRYNFSSYGAGRSSQESELKFKVISRQTKQQRKEAMQAAIDDGKLFMLTVV